MRDLKCKLGSWMQQFRIVVRIRKLLLEAASDISSNVPPALERKKQKKDYGSDWHRDLELLCKGGRAISNKTIFAFLKKMEVCDLQCLQKLLTLLLTLHQVSDLRPSSLKEWFAHLPWKVLECALLTDERVLAKDFVTFSPTSHGHNIVAWV